MVFHLSQDKINSWRKVIYSFHRGKWWKKQVTFSKIVCKSKLSIFMATPISAISHFLNFLYVKPLWNTVRPSNSGHALNSGQNVQSQKGTKNYNSFHAWCQWEHALDIIWMTHLFWFSSEITSDNYLMNVKATTKFDCTTGSNLPNRMPRQE